MTMHRTSSNYRRLALHSFILYSGFAVVNPHLSILFQVKGFSSQTIGILMSAFFISGLIGPLCMTRLVQNNQWYRLFFIVMALGALIFIFVVGKLEQWYFLLFFNFCFGFLFHSFAPMSDATLMHVLENPYQDYGSIRAIGTVGFIFLSVIFTLFPLINLNSASSIYTAIMFILFVIMISAFLIPKSTKIEQDTSRIHISLSKAIQAFPKSFVILLVVVLTNFIGLATIAVYLPLYIKIEYNFTNASSIWILAASAEIIGFIWGQRIVNRIGYFTSLMIVLGGTFTRLVLLSVFHSVILVFLVQILHIFSFAFCLSTMVHYINRHIPTRYKPVALGIQQGFIAFARMIASILGGLVLDSVGFSNMFLINSSFVVLGMVILLLFNKRMRYI